VTTRIESTPGLVRIQTDSTSLAAFTLESPYRSHTSNNLSQRIERATPVKPLTMQRIDPRPEPSQQSTTPPQQQSQAQQQQQSQGQAQQFMPTGFASTGANPHTQSFEEIYGIPENFLEIEVRSSC
jgi:hypothetical protein